MHVLAARLLRPANVLLAVLVGLALLRALARRGPPRPVAPALMESMVGEEDPGAAWEEFHLHSGAMLHRVEAARP
ncbi:MAG: hypothetical protein EPO01_20850 [Aquabacterium sp.]|nr:MAG: hypothetical protein EPO01_20850 [Aquabacterium sp.]